MKVIHEEKLREAVGKYLDAEIARQKEIRDYWAGQWSTGEGNSSLYAKNMTMAQDCIAFLTSTKRGVSCNGCEIRTRAVQLEKEVYWLRQEIKSQQEKEN